MRVRAAWFGLFVVGTVPAQPHPQRARLSNCACPGERVVRAWEDDEAP
jgi:hypothetical protein